MLASEVRSRLRAVRDRFALVRRFGVVRRSLGREGWCAGPLALALTMASCILVGCSSPPALEPVEGVTLGPDGLFRGMDLEGVSETDAFSRLLQRVKAHFGSGSVFQDAELKTVEVERPFEGRAARVRFMAQVGAVEGGSRVELFTRLEELREDISDDPQNPWVASDPDRDLLLEDFFFRALHEDLVVAPAARARLDALQKLAPENPGSSPDAPTDGS